MDKMTGKRAKQSDIARLAGVSQATVSLVINNRGDELGINAETRQRVLDAVRELGYVADPVARSLAGHQNRLLGVYTFEQVFPVRHRDFYNPFFVGIEEECEAQGYDLVLFTSTADAGGRRSVYRGGVNRLRLADGCILLGRDPNREELVRLGGEGFPFVFIGQRDTPGGTTVYVSPDYAAGVADIVTHLAGLGHTQIAFVGDLTVREADRERERGFRAGLSNLGLPDTGLVIRASDRDIDRGWVDAMFRRGITAMFVENPETAERIHTLATRLGHQLPSDYSLTTLVDLSEDAESGIDWTGLHIPRQELGRRAVALLVEMLEIGATSDQNEVLPCTFVPGATVGPPPIRV